MGVVRVLSTDTIKAPKSSDRKIDLTPWDLQFLSILTNKKGLLYHHPPVANQIQQLKHSLSSVLEFFQPLAGRLKITEHKDNIISCSVICNNTGVLFIHAVVENTCVADILEPIYVPSIVNSFFPFIGVSNYEGTSQPLLGVQVTELVDGIFIGCTFNHVVVDGNSLWHFINSWAEISRNSCHHHISKLPILERWFPNDIQHPIQFPFTMDPSDDGSSSSPSEDERLNISERIFHFKKEKIFQLKSKINTHIDSTIKISSLQALLTHVWCSFVRSKQFDPQEEIHNRFAIGVGTRLLPPLPKGYFGNTVIGCMVTMKAGELLKENGLRNGAWEMNKLIASYSNEKIRNHYESWLKNPNIVRFNGILNNNFLVISSSPHFDVYGNDFGWGKPVAVRSSIKVNGLVTVFAGVEEGSIDLQLCLPYNILEAMGNDLQLMDLVSN
ncbi:protein ENHANCED PSEUDOMONAS SUSCEPTIBILITY 1-like [Vicia villosa]|uniref:protein ENHANCED PSEUDOMONAS SUSCEPTIBILITY 1-like n=1 Tax=Vicia villosa TaxID=3911 RepID=UPI00273C4E93|nr:protein ENHANCED PSEUDOMONAS SUSCEPTIBILITY 1-like [Vicia villosa]